MFCHKTYFRLRVVTVPLKIQVFPSGNNLYTSYNRRYFKVVYHGIVVTSTSMLIMLINIYVYSEKVVSQWFICLLDRLKIWHSIHEQHARRLQIVTFHNDKTTGDAVRKMPEEIISIWTLETLVSIATYNYKSIGQVVYENMK